MTHSRFFLSLAAGAMTAALATFGLLGSGAGVADPQPAPPPVAPEGWKTMVVEVRSTGSLASLGGTVVPFEEIVFTAQMPGRVEKLAGGEGDFFRKGDALVKIDDEEIRAQRLAALADVRNAEAAVRNAGVQLYRERENPTPTNRDMMSQFMPMNPMSMFGKNGNTSVDRGANLYSYGTQVEQARAQVMQAQSRLREIEARMKDTDSVAPFDGYITEKHVSKGDTVQPGQPLVKFANMTYLQIQADVPSRLSAGLQPGAFLEVRLDDVNKTRTQARVAQVFPMADPTRHTIRVKLDLPTTVAAKAGMYAEVFLTEPGQMSGAFPVIPASAVVNRGGLPMVYVIGPDQRPQLHLLRLGERMGDQFVVLTGLRGGETIVLNP